MKIFDIRNRFSSLVKQITQVGIGFLVMLLLTSGRPPAFIVNLSASLSIVFVAYSEARRLALGKSKSSKHIRVCPVSYV